MILAKVRLMIKRKSKARKMAIRVCRTKTKEVTILNGIQQ
jgi:hypothetical protein